MANKQTQPYAEWNKITLRQDTRQHILHNFKKVLQPKMQEVDMAVHDLYPLWRAEAMKQLKITEEDIERAKKGLSPFQLTNHLTVRIILPKKEDEAHAPRFQSVEFSANKGSRWGAREDYHKPFAKYEPVVTPWRDNSPSTIAVKAGTPLGRKTLTALKKRKQVKDSVSELTGSFSVMLNKCRNVGQLLRMYPQAKEWLPSDWQPTNRNTEVAPINVGDFAASLKALIGNGTKTSS